ncbi:unnamed protein product [Brachionus calyciflorus]|uniref:Uncharacterized protein n=1 Tax=Brachionus calyciflorus TaxID=104777 RepID=A0A813RFH7_9BILA|nr:unnamed protein product [Brachionus calyciflorus]
MLTKKKLAFIAFALILPVYLSNGQEVCRKRKTFNETCDNEFNACDPKIGLTCNSSVCACNSTNQFFDLNTNLCVASCPNDTYTNKIEKTCFTCDNDTIYNFKLNICTSSCPTTYEPDEARKNCVCPKTAKYLDNETCVSECPIRKFLNETTNECFSCQPNEYYNYHLQQCLEICPRGSEYDEEAKACSCPLEQYLNKNKRRCEKTFFSFIRPNELRKTFECPDFYDFGSDSCVVNCSSGSQIDFELKSCLTCSSSTKKFIRHSLSCADKCTDLQDTNEYGVCTCPPEESFLSLTNNTCLSTCPQDFVKDNFLNTCSCPHSLFFSIDTLSCISDCQGATVDLDRNICYNCTNGTYFSYEISACSDKCQEGYIRDEIQSKCVLCPKDESFYIEAIGLCVDDCSETATTVNEKVCRCPDTKLLNFHDNECIADSDCSGKREQNGLICKCPKDFPYWLESVCVKVCPADYYTDEAKMNCISMTCPSDEYFDEVTKLCTKIDLCIAPNIYISEYKKCVPCSNANYTFYTPTFECVKECIPPFVRSSSDSNLCICRAPFYFYDMELKQCVRECSLFAFEDVISKRCITCSGYTPYYDIQTSKCVSGYGCSKKSFLNTATSNCIGCPDGFKFLSPVGICLKDCDDTVYDIDTRNNICTCKDSKYYDYFSGTCKDSCGELDADENTKTCKCFDESYINSTGQCADICSSGNFYFGFEQRCFTCDNYLPSSGVISQEQCTDVACDSSLADDEVSGISACICPFGSIDIAGAPYECTIDCDSKNFKYKDPDNYICSYCPSTTNYFFTNIFKCVTSCPFYAKINSETRECTCEGETRLYDFNSNSCVLKCPLNSAPNPLPADTCLTCSDMFPYFDPEKYACVNMCDGLQKLNQLTNECVECRYGMIEHTSECLSEDEECSVDFSSTTDNICRCSNNYLKETRGCVDSCPPGFNFDNERKLCFCSKYKFVNVYTETCEDRSTCSLGSTIVDNNICICAADEVLNPYTFKCEKSCPDGSAPDPDFNICYCDSSNYIDYFNTITYKCEAKCPSNMDILVNVIYGDNFFYCSCPNIYPYIYNDSCTGTIPEKSLIDPFTRRIYTCSESMFLVQKYPPECVTDCPIGTIPDRISQACRCPDDQYYEPITAKCVTLCPVNSFPDKVTKNCVDCKDWLYDETSFTCVSKCPPGLYTDYVTRTCRCFDSSHVYVKELEICEPKCPVSALDYKTSCFCPETKYLVSYFNMCVDASLCKILNYEKKICESWTTYYNFHTGQFSDKECESPLEEESKKICQCPDDKFYYEYSGRATCEDSCDDTQITKILSKRCLTFGNG